ncbi:MAG TPA: bifunctional adenosylcobinamide kinase/adenosylcobinamide-phosphate guanylyltransferase [Lentisphaeria bacterium]|nr:MAG: bifunctional adenosylcobinamide kinase/adenosylcobinamide-phosphate guanylyltransferase [Lentisphaerae bacterium GWF2_49_21]HBC86296.1 bifunctional adenosylcobinamide kinase/adenosylcobinamide-phosphate guanylyltransferase [Lentisphaeria bacterium]
MSSYLITGGSRSGKSRYALELAKSAKKPFYIATGWAGDEEMDERIQKHRKERGKHWTTIETKTDIASAIAKAERKGADFIIVDCLTLWISNMMFEKTNIEKETRKVIDVIKSARKANLIFVTNEVGSGIVPLDKESREFRDVAGLANQKIAAAVDNVVLTVCGQPLYIKGK